jgi:hypothetical protein
VAAAVARTARRAAPRTGHACWLARELLEYQDMPAGRREPGGGQYQAIMEARVRDAARHAPDVTIAWLVSALAAATAASPAAAGAVWRRIAETPGG